MKNSLSTKKRLLFIVTTLGSGGAERVLINTIKSLKDQYEITVLSFINQGELVSEVSDLCQYKYMYPSTPAPFLSCRLWQALLTRWQKVFSPKRLCGKYLKDSYDIEIAWLEGIPTRILSGGQARRKIAWIHTDLSKHMMDKRAYRNLAERKKIYNEFDDIAAVSTEVKDAAISSIGLVDGSVKVIYNIIDDSKIKTLSKNKNKIDMPKNRFNIVIVGSLLPVKAHVRLLDALSDLRKMTKQKFHLYIVGEGPEKSNINAKIIDLNMKDTVTLTGFCDNPYPLIKKANLLVSVSYAEGYSSTVCEALILGVPVMVTDCAGMHDLLGDSEFGLIVTNDKQGITDGLMDIISDKKQLSYYKEKAEKISEMLSLEKSALRVNSFLTKSVDLCLDEELHTKK